jgi:DNA-binding transcriptional LysR family regulator
MFRLRAVARSDMLGIAVKPNVQEVAARLGLRILPMRRDDWVRPVAVAYRKHGYLSPAARRFIQVLKATAVTPRTERRLLARK